MRGEKLGRGVRLPWRLRYLRDVIAPLIRAIGVRNALLASRFLTRAAFELRPPARERIESSLSGAFGNTLPPEDRTALARAVCENIAAFWVEVICCRRLLHASNWRCVVDIPQNDRWAAIAAQKRPAVLVTADIDNPVVGACVLGSLLGPLHVVVDPAALLLAQGERQLLRRFPNLRLVPTPEAARLPGILAAGGRILLIAGRRPRTGGFPCPFLGATRRQTAAPARLAIGHGADLITFACQRRPEPFRFELHLLDQTLCDVGHRQARFLTHRWSDALDAFIRRHPEQYLWTRLSP